MKKELSLKGEAKVNKIEKGSVIMQLEVSSEDAENLYLAIKLNKISGLKIKGVKLIGFEQIDQFDEAELDKIQTQIKDELSVQIDKGLISLEKVLHKKSERYDELIIIKNNHIKIERMNNQKLIDFDTYMVQSNRILNSLIRLVGQLTNVDIFRTSKA